MEALLRAEGLEVGFNADTPLISEVNLALFPGEVVAVAGPSGIGKTTLIRTLAGLVPSLSGSITYGDASRPERGWLGYIPQRLGLVRHASVSHNVNLGARAGGASSLWPFSSVARERAEEAIGRMGLTDKMNEPIRRLSGGQQRRVATARTLAQQPTVLLADEFLGELDEETTRLVADAVLGDVRARGAALLMIEHDLARARALADRILHVQGGRIHEEVVE